jgi:putative protein-disulfide isomerase
MGKKTNNSTEKPVLYYVHDPMCSWCWGFLPVWQRVQNVLEDKVDIRYVLGGLAPDTDRPMPLSMQKVIKGTWSRIQQEIPGTDFNFDFWSDCSPRRSTYPACRAVVAASMQDESFSRQMLSAIQQAYYQRAKNPSDDEVLIELAEEIGLDTGRFGTDIYSDECDHIFKRQLRMTASLGVTAFPSLVLERRGEYVRIPIDYTDSNKLLTRIFEVC